MRLLLIIGPPAVGKMAIGQRIAARSDFRLFHNHHTIEPLLEIFGHGTEPFNVLNFEFRRRIIEEAARAGQDLVFTLVWDLRDPEDAEYVEDLVAPYERAGGEAVVVELAATLEARLERNRGQSRLEAKASKRDLAWSDGNVRAMEVHQMNTADDGVPTPADEFLKARRHLRLDTTNLPEEKAAEEVLIWLADPQP